MEFSKDIVYVSKFFSCTTVLEKKLAIQFFLTRDNVLYFVSFS